MRLLLLALAVGGVLVIEPHGTWACDDGYCLPLFETEREAVFFPVVRSEGAKGDGVTGILLLMHRGKPVISYICTPQEVPERVWRCEDTRP